MVWDANNVTPRPVPMPAGQPDAHIPAIVWQYYGDYPKSRDSQGNLIKGDIDPELVNPAYETLVMSGVIPTPSLTS